VSFQAHSFSQKVYIEVIDVNDNYPRPLEPVYWPTVSENSPSNTPVVTISAVDEDPDSVLSYTILSGNPQSLFSINSATGE